MIGMFRLPSEQTFYRLTRYQIEIEIISEWLIQRWHPSVVLGIQRPGLFTLQGLTLKILIIMLLKKTESKKDRSYAIMT